MYDFCGDAGHHHRSQDKHKQNPYKKRTQAWLGQFWAHLLIGYTFRHF